MTQHPRWVNDQTARSCCRVDASASPKPARVHAMERRRPSVRMARSRVPLCATRSTRALEFRQAPWTDRPAEQSVPTVPRRASRPAPGHPAGRPSRRRHSGSVESASLRGQSKPDERASAALRRTKEGPADGGENSQQSIFVLAKARAHDAGVKAVGTKLERALGQLARKQDVAQL